MPISPYRVAAAQATETPQSGALADELTLLPFYGFVWIASIVRVFTGTMDREVFGTELTLALMVVLVLPFLARNGLRDVVARASRVYRGVSRKRKDS